MLDSFNVELSCEQEHRIRSFFKKELDEVYDILNEAEEERDQWKECAEAFNEYITSDDIRDLDYALMKMSVAEGFEP